MKNNEALQTMCERCHNHEMCQGTGCEPRNTLAKLISNYNDCINELCYKCGKYEESYKGACDGCRWEH